jgi:hypothetical protein
LPQHLIPSYIQAATEPFPLRIDKDILYDRILADLKEATSLVPWRNEVTGIGDQVDERITKGTIKSIACKNCFGSWWLFIKSNVEQLPVRVIILILLR